MACTILLVNHAGAQSIKWPIPSWSTLRRNVSLARSLVRLLITSRGIQQPTGPSHAATQFNKPPIPPAVYTYSGRASSSVIQTETRFRKRASYDIHLIPAPQLTHADAPAGENVPAQHRHASVDRHEVVRVRCFTSCPLLQDTMLACSISPQPLPLMHTLVGLQDTSRGIQQPSGPSHHTTQSNKPPILPAVCIYSRRASCAVSSSSEIRTESRLGKRACMTCCAQNVHLSPAGQLSQNVPPWVAEMTEYLPAQHQHTSVDRHEPVCVAVPLF